MTDDGMDGGVLSGDQWEQSQYFPGASGAQLTGPGAKKKPTTTAPLNRVLTGDEWEKAQRLPGPAIKALQLPAIPQLPAPRDATGTGMDKRGKGTLMSDDPTGKDLPWTVANTPTKLAGFFTRQLLAPVVEHPLQTAGMIAAVPVAAALSPLAGLAATVGIGGSMAGGIAQFGYQKYLENHATPDVRREMERDPERIQGEAAAAQAMFLGMGAVAHVGVKARAALDFGPGMMEAGAKGVAEQRFGPDFAPDHPPTRGEESDLNRKFAGSLDEGAATTRIPQDVPHPDGFEPTTGGARLKTTPRAVAGLVTPETVALGKVKSLETDPASAPLQDAADLNTSVREYQQTRVEQDAADLAAARSKAAEKIAKADAMRPKRRPAKQNYFETEQGAEVLGAMAARHGLPEDASPYHPDSPLDAVWKSGHESAAQSYPDGFSMGGALTDNRVPGAVELPKTARGSDPATIPDGATPETVALANALKPSRFRGHTTDELAGAALDAQAEIEQAQQAVTSASQRGLVGEHAQMDMENRGTSYSDEAEGPTKTADAALARAKAKMTQIEREFAVRGVSSDALADVIQGAKEQRAERAGMQSDDALNAHMGVDDPFGEPPTPSSRLTAVEGTGPSRTRGIALGVEQTANALNTTLGDLPDYKTLNMADQASRATDFLAANPEAARRVAVLGDDPPAGILPEAVFTAVENKAKADGDVQMLRDLAFGKLAEDATTMGQRIRLLGERDPESPVDAMRRIAEKRAAGVKDGQMAIDRLTASIKKQLDKAKITPEQLAEFINSLRC